MKTGALSFSSSTVKLTVAVTVVAPSLAVTNRLYEAVVSLSSDDDNTIAPVVGLSKNWVCEDTKA